MGMQADVRAGGQAGNRLPLVAPLPKLVLHPTVPHSQTSTWAGSRGSTSTVTSTGAGAQRQRQAAAGTHEGNQSSSGGSPCMAEASSWLPCASRRRNRGPRCCTAPGNADAAAAAAGPPGAPANAPAAAGGPPATTPTAAAAAAAPTPPSLPLLSLLLLLVMPPTLLLLLLLSSPSSWSSPHGGCSSSACGSSSSPQPEMSREVRWAAMRHSMTLKASSLPCSGQRLCKGRERQGSEGKEWGVGVRRAVDGKDVTGAESESGWCMHNGVSKGWSLL